MIITEIEKLDKKKSRIYIDGRKAFVLYKGEIRKLGLVVSETLSESLYDEIMYVILKKRARSRALHILEKQERTKAQLIEKLKKNEYPMEIIDDTIEYVESYHYIDDLRYATQFIRCSCAKKSKRQLILDLQRRGIDKSVVEAAFQNMSSEINMKKAEDGLIQKLIKKKIPDFGSASQKDIQRTYRYLMSKGFSYDDIKKYMHLTEMAE